MPLLTWPPVQQQRYHSFAVGVLWLLWYIFPHEFLFNLHFDLEPDYIIRKGMQHRIQRYTVRTEILSTFHTRVECISQRHWPIETNACRDAKKCHKPCQKQTLPLEARGLPSNTWMPGPIPLTTPNDSSIALRTSTQRCNKVPIGYNATPQIHPPNCPFPFDDHHQNLIHPFRARRHSPPQTASRSNQPFCHNTHVRTDEDDECSITIPLRSAILIASDALIIQTSQVTIGVLITTVCT